MRVLVVEDAPALAEVVAEGLRDQGMAVDVALDGEDGPFGGHALATNGLLHDDVLARLRTGDETEDGA